MKPKNQICEFADCKNPAVVQGKIGHPLEDKWLCKECNHNPLGVVEETEIQQLQNKIAEKKAHIRELQKELRTQIVEYENEIKQTIFDGLKTYRTHPKILIDREKNDCKDLEEDLKRVRSNIEAPEHLALGTWTCLASPTGSCVYNEVNDSNRDCCIFCGEPEERI